MNIAIILAGGSGTRVGEDIPKQYIKVAGKKIIEHTLEIFQNNSNIDEICIVCSENYIDLNHKIVEANNFTKVRKILVGGKERYESSLHAILAYNDDDNLIFHDAVRPLVNDRIIDDCINALSIYDAVDVAIETADTIIKVNEENCIDSIPYRPLLRNGQTPQCFKRSIIKKAYDIALNDPDFKTTDDCSVVRKYLPETKIFIVHGEVFNMKVTFKEDLHFLDKLFQLKHITMTESGSLNNLYNKIVVVFGGHSGIGKELCSIIYSNNGIAIPLSRQDNVDVSDIYSVISSLNDVYKRYNRIDSVIDCAAVLYKQSLDSSDDAKIIETINTNYLGAINIAKASYMYLKESKGSLLFFSSSSYTKGREMYSVYSSSKAAIVNFTQALSEEWTNDNIKVNCIVPSRTATPMRYNAFGQEDPSTLLDPKYVAEITANTITKDFTGQIIDIKL